MLEPNTESDSAAGIKQENKESRLKGPKFTQMSELKG